MTTSYNLPLINLRVYKEIIDLVLPVQDDSLATVFVNFSGHVQSVHVQIFEGSWHSEAMATYDRYFWLDMNCEEKLTELKNYINTLYEQNNG